MFPVAALAASSWFIDDPWLRWLLVIVAGGLEGASLGFAQSMVLRSSPLRVPVRGWTLATGVAASSAWSIGMLPSTLNDSGHAVDFGRPLVWAGTILGALILLLSIPVAQWIVLRRVLRRAWRWIPVNVAAWTVGLTFTLLPGPFVDEQTAAGVMVVAFVVGGICMAATVATCTGLWLRRELGQELRIESKKRVSLRESGLNA
ncbi:hypothetical protein BFL43_06250 [Williamsia sp. 1135]|nr:hypothetical protein BFL43_06250 [Williamsia sp. 1135]